MKGLEKTEYLKLFLPDEILNGEDHDLVSARGLHRDIEASTADFGSWWGYRMKSLKLRPGLHFSIEEIETTSHHRHQFYDYWVPVEVARSLIDRKDRWDIYGIWYLLPCLMSEGRDGVVRVAIDQHRARMKLARAA